MSIQLEASVATELVLAARGITKSFGPTRALQNATLELRAGEVHAIVGENGSGKSTLVKILSGVHAPNAGSITIGDRETGAFANPQAAQRSGVATVFQEVLVVESRTVLENVWLGQDGLLRTRIPKADKRRLAAELLAELLEAPPSIDALVEELSLSDRQALGIIRALLRKPAVLILDEATSALDYETRTRLFSIVQRRGQGGTAVVLITHRMDEINEIGDRVTVMRSGETVATLARGEWDDATLVRLMTGAAHLTETEATPEPADSTRMASKDGPLAAPVLSARAVRLAPQAKAFDFDIRPGEIVGLAGLEGHGQDAFIKALWGGPLAEGAVTRPQAGGEVAIENPHIAAHHKIAYVPRERRAESLLERLSILDNFALPTIGADAPGGVVSERRTRSRLAEYTASLKIKFGRDTDAISTLSGGNQQKVVIARWLATAPEVLLLNDPTRGIDINAKRDLYALLARLVSQGLAVVMLSTEVDEHVELMDRVLVFRENNLSREIARGELTRERLVASFFGETEPAK